MNYTINLAGEVAMMAFGVKLASVCNSGLMIHLEGNLGAGKTTLVRGFMRGMGHSGAVRSPTYTLVEPYELQGRHCYHMDLYRLADPEELEYIGLRDMLDQQSVCLVEWPEQGQGILPSADLLIKIEYVDEARALCLEAQTENGEALLRQLQDIPNEVG